MRLTNIPVLVFKKADAAFPGGIPFGKTKKLVRLCLDETDDVFPEEAESCEVKVQGVSQVFYKRGNPLETAGLFAELVSLPMITEEALTGFGFRELAS